MTKNNEIAIKVTGVSKSFKLPHEKSTSIKGALVGLFRTKRTYEKQEVLKDISFEIKKGEFFGIVGRNGSGKSTLLKLLAGIYTPDKGHIQINGKLTPFIELGVGFNPELTGRENVFLNGALLGFSRKEMEAMYDEIVDFAELEKFMDQKLKNYSSGMQVRLAFAIAIQAESEVLLLDEVLAVGDESFQKKCFRYFAQLRRAGRTVILVSHDMDAVRRFCKSAILLKDGKVVLIGSSVEIAEKYSAINMLEEEVNNAREAAVNSKNGQKFEKEYREASLDVRLFNQDRETRKAFSPQEQIVVDVTLAMKQDIEGAVLGMTIEKSNKETIFWTTTEISQESKLPELMKKGDKQKVQFVIQNIFGDDEYEVDVALMSGDRTLTYARRDAIPFTITGRGLGKGWLLHPDFKILHK